MSVLQYPEGLETKDVQIWNNAAFDNANLYEENESLESFSSKENQNPLLDSNSYGFEINSSVSSIKSSGPFKPINSNGVVENLKMNPIKADSKQGFSKKVVLKCSEARDEKEIDKEIEEIEMEINRLSSRLEALRIEKVEKSVKTVERRGRIVSAKFMEPKKIEEHLPMSAKSKVQRRGLSVGPVEIMAGSRRGMSLGPSEIVSGTKSRKLTPIPPIQNRRKSCFLKLQDIDEEKLIKERGKNLSASPKTRKCIPENQVTRQAVTTIGSKKAAKKDDFVLNSVQPKRLFKDGEKSVNATNKKPLRQGRAIPSRYNQNTGQVSAMRKRSLPDDDNDESNRCDKKRSLSFGKTHVAQPEKINVGTESREKKRWEIPNEIVIHGNCDDDNSPQSVYVLPRIRIARCTKESPRDSGPAKRVADLVGKKSYFAVDEEVEPSVCQALSFIEEEIVD